MENSEVIRRLEGMADPRRAEGMARYGIRTDRALGVSMPGLRSLAREIGRDRRLAGKLWASGLHEARILASLVDEPGMVTGEQMEAWAAEFNSWDLCDQCCGNLFDRSPLAWEKALEWSAREEEFVKRAGFALMAWLAVHDKKAGDERFEEFLPAIIREAADDRNYVKKAVNWALRQIGKRNLSLNRRAVETAREVGKIDSRAARWTASDALRELTGEKILERLRQKEKR
jgi:3-methyladenine DNA glycosylase AlkD